MSGGRNIDGKCVDGGASNRWCAAREETGVSSVLSEVIKVPDISCDALDCKWNVGRRCTADGVQIGTYDYLTEEDWVCKTYER